MHSADLVMGLAPAAIAGLWQGVVIVVAVALCLHCARRMSAAQRFVLLGAGFVATSILPLVPWFFSFVSSNRVSAAAGSVAAHSWFQLSPSWALAIAAAWLLASVARAVDLIVHSFRLARVWRTATPLRTSTLVLPARSFELCSTSIIERPSVIGFWRPRVLIPNWLLPKLAPEELDQIIQHEATHLARRDDWTNLFQKLCLVVFPLNPALWWMDRQLAREREMACDEAVVRATQAPRAYAACLASLAERGMARRREALALGAWHGRPELVNRVHRILRANRSLSPATAGILLGAFGCGLFGVSVELARCPQLVAFVPRASSVQKAQALSGQSARLGDAVFSTNPRQELLTQDAHIVQARAEMPTAPLAKLPAHRARPEPVSAVGEPHASSEPGTSSTRTSITARQPSAAPKAAMPQEQFVVFTTWQEIETSTPSAQASVADYDTASENGTEATSHAAETKQPRSDAASAESPAQQPGRRTTFTQLILRVVPSSSQTATPAAIPIGGGWIVIQL